MGEEDLEWKKMIEEKEKEIRSIEGIYSKGIENYKVDILERREEMIEEKKIELKDDGRRVKEDKIMIEKGGRKKKKE